ncbi:hypothetical protein RYX36_006092 [Vicia faba]
MNVKPVIFLCFLSALLLIASEATQQSKDEKQATIEVSETKVGLDRWGLGGSHGGHGRGSHGGHRGGHGGGHGGRYGGGHGSGDKTEESKTKVEVDVWGAPIGGGPGGHGSPGGGPGVGRRVPGGPGGGSSGSGGGGGGGGPKGGGGSGRGGGGSKGGGRGGSP